MPALETLDRYQKAVYWAGTGVADMYGREIVSTPVEISVRWEYRRGQTMRPDGTVIGVDATVKLNFIPRIGSQLWLGTLKDWYRLGSAGEDDEVMHVVAIGYVPDLKSRGKVTVASLSKFRDTPSTA